jgi:hypothetical protein
MADVLAEREPNPHDAATARLLGRLTVRPFASRLGLVLVCAVAGAQRE